MNRTSTHTHSGAFFSFVSRWRWRRWYCRDWAAARLNRSFSLNHRGRSDPNRPNLAAQLCEITPNLRYPTWDPIALNRLFFSTENALTLACVSSISCTGENGRKAGVKTEVAGRSRSCRLPVALAYICKYYPSYYFNINRNQHRDSLAIRRSGSFR